MKKTMKTLYTTLIIFLGIGLSQGFTQNEPPTAVCQGNAIVTPIFEGETPSIHAETFNKSSYDDNTGEEALRYAFSSDPADSLLEITCADVGSVEKQLFVFDEEGEVDSCTFTLNIDDQCNNQPIINGTTDTEAPTIFLTDGLELALTDSVTFNPLFAKDFNIGTYDNVSDLSGLQFSYSSDPQDTLIYYHCDDTPKEVNLTIYVTDEAGNQSYSDVTFFIGENGCEFGPIGDNLPPVVQCNSTYSVDLDSDGEATLNASDINNGTEDNITPVQRLNFSFDRQDPTASSIDLNCDNLGESERKLYVWDHEGNIDSCAFTLTVNDPQEACETQDTNAPTAACQSLLQYTLEEDTTYTFTATELDDGSTDDVTDGDDLVFSFSTDTSVQEMTLTCDDLGNNEITLYVTDEAGNQATCTTVVELTDPDEICESVSVTNLEEVQWNIYPNPFSTEFTIEDLPIQKGTIQITIYNIQGQEVFKKEITEANPRIRPDINSGNFILKLTQKGKVIGMHKVSRN